MHMECGSLFTLSGAEGLPLFRHCKRLLSRVRRGRRKSGVESPHSKVENQCQPSSIFQIP